MNYQYWIIRFVPNVARGEFSNIGIVCGRDDGDWAVAIDTRFVGSHGTSTSDVRELSSWTRWFEQAVHAYSTATIVEQSATVSSSWIEHLRSRQANTVQFSAPVPIEVTSAREAVDILFSYLVERGSSHRRKTFTRRAIRTEIRDTLVNELDFVPGSTLFVQPRAIIGKQRGSFDIARAEGSGELLTNVWAFNVATLEPLERDIQSWNYLVGRLRQDGATLTVSPKRTFSLRPDTPVEVVYDPPRGRTDSQWRTEIFEAAIEAWSMNDVTARTLDAYLADVRRRALTLVG